MRIAIDAHLVKRQPTGVGKTIARTIEAMAEVAPTDEFVVYADKDFPDVLAEKPNCRVVRTPLIARSRTVRVLHERFVMPRRVGRDKADVFYAAGYVFPGELGVPMVLAIPDLNALKHPRLVRPETAAYYKHAMPASAARAAFIIAPTHAVASDIARILGIPAQRVRVVPGAVDGRFRDRPRDPASVAAKYGVVPPYVLFVGNIEPNKNLGRLIEAFFAARMNGRLPHKLVIAGKSRYRANDLLRLIRHLECADHVVFTGYVPDADLPGLFAAASAFLYPSVAEGFGMPPLEAMLSGVPTITSDDPALSEVTGDGALHVRAHDIAALREALEKVVTDAGFAAELARRGRDAAAQYSWTQTARGTLEVLHEAAGVVS